MKAQDILTDESKWCKNYLGMTPDGLGVRECHPKAVSFCLIGAIFKAYHCNSVYVVDRVRNHLGTSSVAKWNNEPERTFAQVRALIEELDI